METIKDVYWLRAERELVGRYSFVVHGSAATTEYVVDDENTLRIRCESIIKRYGLINIVPDITANPQAIDVICCTRENSSVLFCDETQLSSTTKFKNAHEQIIKMRLKSVIAASKHAEKDWLIAADDFQVLMLRKAKIKRIYQDHSHVMFEFKGARADYLSDWNSSEKAKLYLQKFEQQFLAR